MADERIQRSRSRKLTRIADDEDDAPRPRRRSARKEISAFPVLLIALIGGGALVLCGCPVLGLGVWLLVRKEERVVEVPIGADPAPPMGIDPPRPPANNVKPIKAPTTRFAIPPLHGAVADIAFAPRAQGVAYLYHDTIGNFRDVIEYWDWKTPKKLARLELANIDNWFDVSPQGTRLVAWRQGKPAPSIWSLPDAKPISQAWEPYPNKKLGGPRLVWASYLDETRLLTIAENGQFDVWDMNRQQVVASNPPPQKFVFLIANGFARAPQNFALSPDRKWLALPNGDGFEFFDTTTARSVGRTASMAKEGNVGNIWAGAFSLDGKKFACKGNVIPLGGAQKEYISVWDVPSGVRKHHVSVPLEFNRTGPIAWGSARYLVIYDGNRFTGTVLDLTAGRYVQEFQGALASQRFAATIPDGRIWYAASAVAGQPANMLAVPFPENELNQQPAPANQQQLPRWYLGTAGITRERP